MEGGLQFWGELNYDSMLQCRVLAGVRISRVYETQQMVFGAKEGEGRANRARNFWVGDKVTALLCTLTVFSFVKSSSSLL